MKVQPKTEKELVEARLLPKGWYPFTIGEAEEKLSKKGNEMIELNIQVYKDAGFVFVKDWLMDTEYGAQKLRHAADTCGLLSDYENGLLKASDFKDREGFVKIGIQKRDDGYPDQNKIDDYATKPPEAKDKATAGKETSPFVPNEDDKEIPFN